MLGTSKTSSSTNKILVKVFIQIAWGKNKFVCTFCKTKSCNKFCQLAQSKSKEKKMEPQTQITLYLNAIYQNTRTAVQSIEDIITKVENKDLICELAKEQDEYSCLATECENFARSQQIEGLKDNNWIEKAKLWTSINLGTMMDKSTRNIAEMMLLGTFMGVVTCIKDRHDHKNVSKDLDEILEKLLNFERDNIDKLLPYLEK